MLMGQDIAVLGGGVAGLAVAQAVALHGAKVTLYERAPEITEVGAGLQISPNGARVLAALGLDAPGRAMRSEGVCLMDGYTGREVLAMDFKTARPKDDFLLMHRADLIALLEEGARAAGVTICLSHDVSAVEGDAEGVTLRFTNGRSARHAVVLGADGLHSVLRPMLNGPEKPFFTGQTAWRATVPALGGEEPVALVHMAAGRHVVSYPLREGRLINIVAVEERPDWVEEGWHHPGDPVELMTHFTNFCPGVKGLLSRAETVSRWGLFRHPVAETWHSERTAILGDAAHPTLPFLAQGANMALEDAWVLATCLAQLPLEQALPAYQARRRNRVVRVIEAANGNARNYHLKGLTRVAGHLALRLGGRIAPRVPFEKFSWLYDYDVTGPQA